MPRSLKKGPFLDGHLIKKIQVAAENQDRRVIKTWRSEERRVGKECRL